MKRVPKRLPPSEQAPENTRRTPEFGFWWNEGYRLPENFDDPDPEIEALFYGDHPDST